MAALTDDLLKESETDLKVGLLTVLHHDVMWQLLPFLSIFDFLALLSTSKSTRRRCDCSRFWRLFLDQLQSSNAATKRRCRKKSKSGCGPPIVQNLYGSFVFDRAKSLVASIHLQYESTLDRHVFMEFQRVAAAAIASQLVVAKPNQKTCGHSQLALLLSKTLYGENNAAHRKRHPIHVKCTVCRQRCYDSCIVCCCSSNTTSPTCFCVDCHATGVGIGQHQRHPRREAAPEVAFADAKDYAVHCLRCGIALLVRIRSNSVSTFASQTQLQLNSSSLLVRAEFICPVRDKMSFSDDCRNRMRASTDYFLDSSGRRHFDDLN
jgi:hypothetical protein